MKYSTFMGRSPYEIGDIVKNLQVEGKIFDGTIEDICAMHFVKYSRVEFRYKIKELGQYVSLHKPGKNKGDDGVEKYGADYGTIEPTKYQLEMLAKLEAASKKTLSKPETFKEAQDLIDEMEKVSNEDEN